jgi:predicted flavoprotein YhiN
MPKLGASPIGYKVAEQFGLNVLPTIAALVPFTLHDHDKERFEGLSGISIDCQVTSENGMSFRENILFTHRGLSGPAILQISSYWQAGEAVTINLLPEKNLSEIINDWREQLPQKSLKNLLSTLFPRRFIETLINDGTLVTNTAEKAINQLNHDEIDNLTGAIHAWQIKPNGTEGYRTPKFRISYLSKIAA